MQESKNENTFIVSWTSENNRHAALGSIGAHTALSFHYPFCRCAIPPRSAKRRGYTDVSWLFGSLKIHYFMADGQASYYVKFLWLTLLDSEREKKEKKKRKSLFSGKRKRKGKSANTSPNTDKSTQPQISAKEDAARSRPIGHRLYSQ